MLFILNTPIIYHAIPSLIMHELWSIITHIFHYHELQAPRIFQKYTLLMAILVSPFIIMVLLGEAQCEGSAMTNTGYHQVTILP